MMMNGEDHRSLHPIMSKKGQSALNIRSGGDRETTTMINNKDPRAQTTMVVSSSDGPPVLVIIVHRSTTEKDKGTTTEGFRLRMPVQEDDKRLLVERAFAFYSNEWNKMISGKRLKQEQ